MGKTKFCNHLLRLKAYFEGKGIAVSGGVTTCDDAKGEGFLSLCYSSEKGLQIVKEAFTLAAELFDEIILDDFYFANCRCPECVVKKGKRSWSEFRLAQKQEITREYVMKTVSVEGSAGVMLFVYDNDKIILRSDLPYDETFSLKLHKKIKGVRNLVTGEQIEADGDTVSLRMMPCVNYVMEII